MLTRCQKRMGQVGYSCMIGWVVPFSLGRVTWAYLIFLETTIIDLHFAADNMNLSLLNFYGWLCKTELFLQEWLFGRTKSSKVIDVGTNWKRVWDFLLVRHSSLGPILHRFGDIAGFSPDPTPIPPFWGCSHCTKSPLLGSMWAGALSYSAVKLFSKYSNLCDHAYLNVIQTDE